MRVFPALPFWSPQHACNLDVHGRPTPECGQGITVDLVAPDFDFFVVGTCTWINDTAQIFALSETAYGFFSESYVYIAEVGHAILPESQGGLPVETNGFPAFIRYPYHCADAPIDFSYLAAVPLNRSWQCNDVSCFSLFVSSQDSAEPGWFSTPTRLRNLAD